VALVYADLHIHIGKTKRGTPVKIPASPALTLETIVKTAQLKGLQMVGIADAACSGVLADLEALLDRGTIEPVTGGGYRWGQITLLLGSEVEIGHDGGKEAHFLGFFPNLAAVQDYAAWIGPAVTNAALSTQRLKADGNTWLQAVAACGGVAVAAHAFTPHKGVYGSCVRRLGEMFACPEQFAALELGLSADTAMAQTIADTHRYAYLANSDAHSPASIGREFTVYELPEISFRAWRNALRNRGQGIAALHGMTPLLGRYHRSFCASCGVLAAEPRAVLSCPHCGRRMITGVWDRVHQIADSSEQAPDRPPYKAHVPLAMLPGIGPATCTKLLQEVGPELDILYHAPLEEIRRGGGLRAAASIHRFRTGQLTLHPGGGGKYGKVT